MSTRYDRNLYGVQVGRVDDALPSLLKLSSDRLQDMHKICGIILGNCVAEPTRTNTIKIKEGIETELSARSIVELAHSEDSNSIIGGTIRCISNFLFK